MRLLFDIEGDGLLDTVSKCWCIVTQDIDTGAVESYTPQSISGGLEALLSADLLVGHNLCGYDIPALRKLYRSFDVTKPFPKVLDTLVVSRFLWPERPWGHSLGAWGEHLGVKKGDYSDWSKYSPEMLEYCQQDVNVNLEILRALEKEYGGKLRGYAVY